MIDVLVALLIDTAEYNRLVADRKREEREAEAAKKLKREKLAEVIDIVIYGFAGCFVGGLVCWGLFEYVVYKLKG